MKNVALVFVLFVACARVCASSQPLIQPRGQEVLLEVELDIFSGRPNPRWKLTEAQEAEFVALLGKLKSVRGSLPTTGGLGYRGFVVLGNKGDLQGYDEVRVFRGIALARRGNNEALYVDPKRTLETWLLASAGGNLDEPVLKYLRGEIRR